MSADDNVSQTDRPYGDDYGDDYRSDYRGDYGRDYEPEPRPWSTWALVAALIVVIAGTSYYLWQQRGPAFPARVELEPPVEVLPQPPGKPAIRHPVPDADVQAEAPLPALEQSDERIGGLVAELLGPEAFKSFVTPSQLIRRIVATVDSLPRKIAPVRMRPVPPVAGQFTPGAGNAARYASHVKAFEALDAGALVNGYVKLYPLFQRAYAELGYPDDYFNDRVVEAIDDLLAAPDLASPPALEQPKVLYQYADPALEGRSAGQKIMMRLGRGHAAKVKAKLREIRRELTAGGPDGRKISDQ